MDSAEPKETLLIHPGERVDDLMRGNLRIIQRHDVFRFGTDAVLLADFASARGGERVCDLGTGCGILPLLLIGRAPGLAIDAVEIQPMLADMATRSVRLNHLDEKIRVHELDLRRIEPDAALQPSSYDCVVCNPPYSRAGQDTPSENEAIRIAREEIACTLDDVMRAAFYLLRNGGRLCMVHRSDRTADVIDGMRRARIEPKAMRSVHHTARDASKFVLFEGRKLAGPGMNVLPPLLLNNADGNHSEEYIRIYGL